MVGSTVWELSAGAAVEEEVAEVELVIAVVEVDVGEVVQNLWHFHY